MINSARWRSNLRWGGSAVDAAPRAPVIMEYQELKRSNPPAVSPKLRSKSSDTWVALGDQGLYSATSFATTLLIARNASVQELGWFSAGISILITAIGFMSSFVAIPLMLTIQGLSPRDRARHLREGLGAAVAMAAVVAVAMLFAAPAMVAWNTRPVELTGWLLVMGAVVVPMVVREYARQMAFAQPGLPGLAIMDLAYGVVALGGLAALAHWGQLNAQRGLAIVGSAACVSVLAWRVAARATVSWTAIVEAPRFLRSHLRMSRWLCGASVLYACSVSAVPWMLGLFASSTSVGVFAAYATIAGVLNPLLLVGSNLTAPRTARAAKLDKHRAVRRVALTASTALALGLCLIGIVIALSESTLVPLLFGARFHLEAFVLWLLVGAAVCEALGTGAFWGLHSLGESRLAFWARAAAVVVSVPLGAWAILRLGVVGAAALMLALRALNAAFNWTLFWGVSGNHRATVLKLPNASAMVEQPLVAFTPEGVQ